VDLLGRQLLCTPQIIDVIRVSSVNEDVPSLEMRGKIGDGNIDNPAGTISQIARGFSSLLTTSASDVAPTAFSLISSFTACGDLLNTTQV
jgi:hypothetical protein